MRWTVKALLERLEALEAGQARPEALAAAEARIGALEQANDRLLAQQYLLHERVAAIESRTPGVQQAPQSEALLSVKRAAHRIGRSESLVRKLIRSKKIDYRRVGARVFIVESALPTTGSARR